MRRRCFANSFFRKLSRSGNSRLSRLFPPRQTQPTEPWHNKGRQKSSILTMNGRVELWRQVYWNPRRGTVIPLDAALGSERYSVGVQELCCRVGGTASFRHAAEDLARTAQLSVSAETVRQIVEARAHQVLQAQRQGHLTPAWTSADCRSDAQSPTCLITGADGVLVPLVTEVEKAKRRQQRRRRRKGQPLRRRLCKGSDQAYKEFKIIAFYDADGSHPYAAGTSGDHNQAGRLMRQYGRMLAIDKAQVKYSVTDGAEWIRRQYASQLPMLDAHVLDYYHRREHVIVTGQVLHGVGSEASVQWRKEVTGVLIEQGPLAVLDRLGDEWKTLRSARKRRAIQELRQYIGKRVEMLDYPAFRAQEYALGSGPTESFCKRLTSRLKGSGMRWDKPHAEGLMALAAIRSSRLWQQYWTLVKTDVA